MNSPFGDQLSAVHRVFGVPELFQLVYNLLGHDAVVLPRLSRRTFAKSVPFVWANIIDRQLFHLIPGTKYVDDVKPGETSPRYVHVLPSEIDLIRLKLYAPFVKQLRVSSPCTINSFQRLTQAIQEAALVPLLPNLLELFIPQCRPIRRADTEWATVFFNPNLLAFEIRDSSNPHKLRYPQEEEIDCELVAKISELCPLLEILCISSLGDLLLPVSGLNHLRSLATNEHGANHTVLQALGRLPHLETLELLWDQLDQSHDDIAPVDLSDDSFPSLRKLYLNCNSQLIVAKVCNTPLFFRNLHVASISFRIRDVDKPLISNLERQTYAVFSIGHNNLRITHLTINLHGWFAPSWSIVDLLKQMPLRCLNLSAVVFGPADHESKWYLEPPPVCHPSVGWHDLPAAMPLLEELHLGNRSFHAKNLPVFASMLPHLRELQFYRICLVGDEKVSSLIGRHPVTQAIVIQSDWHTENAYGSTASSSIARYVYDLWPNATFEDVFSPDTADQLNKAIEMLRLQNS